MSGIHRFQYSLRHCDEHSEEAIHHRPDEWHEVYNDRLFEEQEMSDGTRTVTGSDSPSAEWEKRIPY